MVRLWSCSPEEPSASLSVQLEHTCECVVIPSVQRPANHSPSQYLAMKLLLTSLSSLENLFFRLRVEMGKNWEIYHYSCY
jgi:hypothetical protein